MSEHHPSNAVKGASTNDKRVLQAHFSIVLPLLQRWIDDALIVKMLETPAG